MPVQPRNYGIKTRSATAAEKMDGEQVNVSQTTTAPQVQTASGTTTSAASTSTEPTTTASNQVPFVNIQPFDEKRMSAAQWWLLFVQYCGLYSLTEAQMIQRLPFNLTEKAQQWFFRLSEDVKGTLDTLKNAFIDRFDQKSESLSATLKDIKQRTNETVDDYVSRMLNKKADTEHLSPEMLVQLTKEGLKPAIAEMVFQQNIESMDDIIRFGRRAENTLAITRQNQPDNILASMEVMEDRLLKRLTEQMDKTVASIATSGSRQSQGPSRPQFAPRHPGNAFPRRPIMQHPRPRFQMQQRAPQLNGFPPRPRQCNGCGKFCRVRVDCPAYNKKCNFCGIFNHFERVCRTKAAAESAHQGQFRQ